MDSAAASTLSGAAKGFAVAGPLGAVIGGIAGLFSGLSHDKARKYKRYANKEEKAQATLVQANQRREVVRAAYLARASTVAAAGGQESGGLQSSAAQGAISSASTQGIFNLKFFDSLVAHQIVKNYYLKKAGKAQDTANIINSVGSSLTSFAPAIKTGGVNPGDATEAGNGGYGNPNNGPVNV